jgi:hypothetical protein
MKKLVLSAAMFMSLAIPVLAPAAAHATDPCQYETDLPDYEHGFPVDDGGQDDPVDDYCADGETWDDSAGECVATPPPPTRGTAAAPKPTVYADASGNDGAKFHIKLAWDRKRDGFTSQVCPYRPTWLVLKVGRVSWALDDQCHAHWIMSSWHGQKGVSLSSYPTTPQYTDVRLDPGVYPYKVTQEDRTILAGTIRVTGKWIDTTSTDRDYYYQGTDDFWNICIVKHKTILSSGGRLYCSGPAYTIHNPWFKGGIKLHRTIK